MAALTDNRETPQFENDAGYHADWTILNDEIMYAGAMVAVDYLDEVQAASATEGLRVIGVNKYQEVDNAADGETLPVSTGIYRLDNSATYPLSLSGIGLVCYVEDDQTVASYNATAYVPAGIVRDVTSDGVWVEITIKALALARAQCHKVVTSANTAKTVSAAEAFAANNIYMVTAAGAAREVTLPSCVAGMAVAVKRGSATAGDDVTIQAAAGDKIEASDGLTAAAKQIDNTVDAVSDILYLVAVDDTHWLIDNPVPQDIASWVKNDA